MVSQAKLQELVNGGLGTKQHVIEYMDTRTDIISIFTAKREVFHYLLLDSNPQAVPFSGLQKAAARIWPEITKQGMDRGTFLQHEVPITPKGFKEPSGKRYICLMCFYSNNDAIGKKRNDKSFYINIRNSFKKLFETFVAKNIRPKLGMPKIGNDKIWSEIETIIEDVADETGFRGKVMVVQGKSKAVRR